MACETFLKIVSKCKRKLVVLQVRAAPGTGQPKETQGALAARASLP